MAIVCMADRGQALVLHVVGRADAILIGIIGQSLHLQVAHAAVPNLWFHTPHAFVFALLWRV